jgi:DedD protein
MRENNRVRSQRFALSLDAGQVTAVVLGSLVLLGGAFLLGMSAGRQVSAAHAAPVATGAVLEHLDAPLTMRDEPPPALEATRTLTDSRPIEKAMPVVAAKAGPTSTATPTPTPTATATATASAPSPQPSPLAGGKPPFPPSGEREVVATSTSSAKSHAKGAYTIQVASASTRGDAERIVRKLSERNPRIMVADVPGKGRRYRVQVGSYPSQEAAKRQLPQLSRAGIHGIVTALR